MEAEMGDVRRNLKIVEKLSIIALLFMLHMQVIFVDTDHQMKISCKNVDF